MPPYLRAENKNGVIAGGQDKLSDPMDVELLLQVLPHAYVWQWHDEPAYEHLDFIWGINARYLLYQKVLHNLQRGQGGTGEQGLGATW